MAAKRMENELAKVKAKGNDFESKEKRPQQRKSQKTTKKSHGKRKGPEQGPIYKIMKAFLSEKKASGHSHKEALSLWKDSKERAVVVENMSPAERAKRRYN